MGGREEHGGGGGGGGARGWGGEEGECGKVAPNPEKPRTGEARRIRRSLRIRKIGAGAGAGEVLGGVWEGW
jgi:hypothetical protein